MESRHTASDARPSDSYDALVVGAGLGGLAFTLAMEGSGLRVAVVDRNPFRMDRRWVGGMDAAAMVSRCSIPCVLAEAEHEGAQHYEWFAERFGGELLSRWDDSMLDLPHHTLYASAAFLRRIVDPRET